MSSYHPGVSLSNFLIKNERKSLIIFESVLAWDKVNQTRPSVSRAAIIEILGETLFFMALPFPYLSAHVLRIKFVPLSHVSSIFITLFCYWRSVIIVKAYCYLSTRFLALLAWGLSCLALTKLSLKFFFIIFRTNLLLTSKFSWSFTSWHTFWEH